MTLAMFGTKLWTTCARTLILRGLAAFAPFLMATASSAGDFADLEVLGFTGDGGRFAFEQYGIEDGSGFPWSEIVVIDVASDRWIKPSPVKFRDENTPDFPDLDTVLAEARYVSRQSASDSGLLAGVSPRGQTVGRNYVTELSADPHFMEVKPRLIVPSSDEAIAFRLTETPLPDKTCSGYGVETAGFRLTMTYNGQSRTLNDDSRLPSSRGCALGYRIERIITYYPPQADPVFVAMILIESLGFEGPNGRYMAITGKF